MTYYTREIKEPANLEEGLQNFVQMIINRAEAGDIRNALLLAVDLHQDLTCGAYKSVTAPDLSQATVPMDEHLRAIEAARSKAMAEGLKAGANSVKAEMARLLAQ